MGRSKLRQPVIIRIVVWLAVVGEHLLIRDPVLRSHHCRVQPAALRHRQHRIALFVPYSHQSIQVSRSIVAEVRPQAGSSTRSPEGPLAGLGYCGNARTLCPAYQ